MEAVRCCEGNEASTSLNGGLNGRIGPRGSCVHMQAFKHSGGLEMAKPVMQYLCICRHHILGPSPVPVMVGGVQALSVPARCFGCAAPGMGRRLHACLHCVFVGCADGGHLAAHLAEHNHTLAVDVSHGQLYCGACKDYVYDRDFELQAAKEQSTFSAVKQKLAEPSVKQVKYNVWAPSTDDINQLSNNSKRCTVPSNLLGLRGLYNMGNTCFMNCILQSLLHNPLLRNYFLSDLHNRSGCSANRDDICLACELDYLFAEVYSGTGAPYAPYHFLYSMWRHADNLAGYDQQDAHEFLISTLNGLHKHSGGSTAASCRCIVHQIFSGRLRSDLTCLRCGYTSTAIDPFFDISLDLPKARSAPRQAAGSLQQQQTGCNNTYQDSTKQLSMQSLPLVLCFHLKRFKQEGLASTASSSKIDTHIRYPFVLDMSPYASSTIVSQRLGREPPSAPPDLYELFAVVDHKGKIDNGHFVCFVRHESRWFKCDDATITPTQPHQIARSKGSYLLFYMRRSLTYEASSSSAAAPQPPPPAAKPASS
ncbi:ubiquitin carboxylterminal hydrolase 22, putative [Acanthamoeba castellanii str. Neff]|uniref:Ubiquitin carboxyl-terminal hydrolase n=1 Tax=Acanthamoeba castellanii (strain ATCC 30010 / Neff) TaxID=1257118 RepID=L8GTQ9_ACACF|nr:ubiquitin carboxylterminal hydrolase 22, putative [Acanthamoeba castellanii str. Neff]ELR16317.1 ubiquitin carboxylterminal hydrolase 22, putative [Acanthamoeba castellanii str. Neff]